MLEPWAWALAALSAYLVGVSKTGIAGLGILSVVLFANALPGRASVGVVLVILLSADLVAVRIYRHDADWGQLARLFPWAGAGVIIGALTWTLLNDATVRVVIGAIVIVLVGVHLVRRRRPAAEPPDIPAWIAAGTGLLAGVTTMVANAAGPLMVIYLLAMRLPKRMFMGTTAWFFLAVNLFKVPFSVALGLITTDGLAVSLPLVPFAVAGALSGRWILSRIDQNVFETVVLGLSLLAGVRLLLS